MGFYLWVDLMNIFLVILFTICCSIACVVFFLFFLDDRKEGQLVVSGLTGLLGLVFLCWWIKSASEPWTIAHEETLQIKEVTWPDGTKAQLFSYNGKNHNVTELFGKYVDEKEWQVKRTQWAHMYFGVSWRGFGRLGGDGISYYLVKKKGDTSFPLKVN